MGILVTGAAGFIGFHACRHLLERGEHVIGLDNLNDYYSVQLKRDRLAILSAHSSFEFIAADLAEQAQLADELQNKEVSKILHLGAQAGVRYSIDDPHSYVRSNLVGHCNVLEIARSRAVDHLVYASSSSVYGGNDSLPFRVEDGADYPLSLYAATKRSNELASEAYANLYRIPQTGLRFFTAYGPWGRPDMAIWKFTQAILAGQPITLFGEGNMRRDFTFIDDVVEGVIAALYSPPADDRAVKPGGSTAPHRLYNIGNSHSEDLERMVALIEQACGRKAIREIMPMQPGDPRETFADISPIRSDLGFEPRTRIDEGIPAFVDWYRDYSGV